MTVNVNELGLALDRYRCQAGVAPRPAGKKHVFEKLGLETRTARAARRLSLDG